MLVSGVEMSCLLLVQRREQMWYGCGIYSLRRTVPRADSAVLFIPRLRMPGIASIVVAIANTMCTRLRRTDHTEILTIQYRIRAQTRARSS